MTSGFSGDRLAPGIVASTRAARYFLGSDCGLSASAAQSLVRRGPMVDFNERVILTADVPELEQQLRTAGFKVERARPSDPQPRRFRPGGPWLELADAGGEILFDGPYRIFSVKL